MRPDAACMPSPERCGDGVDNDCDGLVDEGFAPGAPCQSGFGACARPGITVCAPDGTDTVCDAVPDPPAAEVCSGADDDCDGVIDEGFDLDDRCRVGTGACAREGLTICTPDGMSTRCDAAPGAPTVEICNAIDDDCDGPVDENFDSDVPCVVGTGACRREGLRICAPDGQTTRCGVAPGAPVPETCDGLDEDCDGVADEDFGAGRACTAGVGACARDGVAVCAPDGDSAVCDAVPGGGTAEICNDLDDDCDGRTDEDFELGVLCVIGQGECARDGVTICADDGDGIVCGRAGGEAVTERCGNNTDDDCDGRIDEGPADGAPCAVGVGNCARVGVYTCDEGTGVATCDALAAEPGIERCDNASDEDCDGTVDEGFDAGEICAAGAGACARDGIIRCGLDGASFCDAAPTMPSDEICDGQTDEDCDGAVDEDFEVGAACAVGIGACSRIGTLACSPDGGVVCDIGPGVPIDEICNGIDDNCDGVIDEGYDLGMTCQNGVGACARDGVIVCAAGGGAICDATAGLPDIERCHGTDADCDGAVDEGYFIGDVCAVGIGTCRREGIRSCGPGGLFTMCDAVRGEAGTERCGEGDEDCDGAIDEGYPTGTPCQVGMGGCGGTGVTICTADGAGVVCSAEIVPGEERCGGGDEDCDDVVDEDFDVGAPCRIGIGACTREGARICTADGLGTICSVQPNDPTNEICNRIDDDCDGEIDEGFFLGAPCADGVGLCLGIGFTVCAADGSATVCGADVGTPEPERCGTGADEDCDGATDEGFELGRPCQSGAGQCARDGQTECAPDGRSEICDADPGAPAAERCGNGIDEDCDGATDEGFDIGAACTAGIGPCEREGAMTCSPGGLATICDAVPTDPLPELCGNEIDDDCDSQVDEGINVGGVCDEWIDDCRLVGTAECGGGGVVVCRDAARPLLAFGAPAALDRQAAERIDAAATEGGSAVTWSTFDGTAYVAFVDAGGITRAAATALGAATDVTNDPTVGAGPDGFLLAWSDSRDGPGTEIYTTTYAVDGTPTDLPTRLTRIEGFAISPRVTWGGNAFSAVWTDNDLGNQEVMFAVIGADGRATIGPVRVTADFNRSFDPDIAPNHHGFAITWVDYRDDRRDLWFARLGPDGNAIGIGAPITAGGISPATPRLAWSGHEYGLAWSDEIEGSRSVLFARLDHQGQVIDAPIVVAIGADDPSIIWTGTGYVVAWRNAGGGASLTEFSAKGRPVDAPVALVADGATISALTWTGTRLGAAWNRGTTVIATGAVTACAPVRPCAIDEYEPELGCGVGVCREGARASACVDGSVQPCTPAVPQPQEAWCDARDEDCNGVVDDAPRKAGADQRIVFGPPSLDSPSVAWTGTDLGVVWADGREGEVDVFFARFAEDGTRLTADIRVSDHDGDATARNPRIEWADGTFGVIWADNRLGNNDIYFARLTEDGEAIGNNLRITPSDADQRTADVAWNGELFFVVWRDSREGHGLEIYSQQLGADGVPIGANTRLTFDPGSSVTPRAVWNGETFAVAWRDFRNGEADVWFAQYTRAGQRVGDERRVTESHAAVSPTIAWGGDGYGLAWVDQGSARPQIWFRSLDAIGAPTSAPVPLSDANREAFHPSVHRTAVEYAVVWDEDQFAFKEGRIARLDFDGALIEPPFFFTDESWQSDEPAVAWTGGSLVAVWHDFRDLEDALYFNHGAFTGCHAGLACLEAAGDERCDGMDDDCDGVADEDCIGLP